ncbi:PQQ-binding-like beta-propeller repeat protein [Candidatus Altiarchaeota archaeon]
MMKRGLVLIALLLGAMVVDAQYEALSLEWNTSIGGDEIHVRDINKDLVPDIIIGSYRKDISYVYALSNKGELEWKNRISIIWPQNEPQASFVDDLDLNGNIDIVVGSTVKSQPCIFSSSPYRTPLFMVERLKGFEYNTLKWQVDNTGLSLALHVGDILGDEKKEVVSGNRDGDVYVVSPGGNVLWKYSTEGTVYSVRIDDVMASDGREVLAGSFRKVHLLNRNGKLIWDYSTGSAVTALDSIDIEDNGKKEVLAITEDGFLHVLDHRGSLKWKYPVRELRDTVTALDMDKDGKREVIVVSGKDIIGLSHDGRRLWNHSIPEPVMNVRALDDPSGNKTSHLIVSCQRRTYSFIMNPDFINDRTADALYDAALASYSNRDYVQAITDAEKAYDIYVQLGDEGSSKKSYTLVNRSHSFIEAGESLELALEHFEDTEFDEAKKYAQKAFNLYEFLGDDEGKNDTYWIIKNALDYRDASYFYKQAIDLYRMAEYDLAKEKAKKSLEIYLILDDKEWMMKSSELVIKGINYKNASKHFSDALTSFYGIEEVRDIASIGEVKDGYSSARDLAGIAKTHYTSVADQQYIENVSILIDMIDERIRNLENRERAIKNHELAYGFFESKRFEECILQGRIALDIYYRTDRMNDTLDVHELVKKCVIGANATKDYARALELRGEESFELSIDYARRAKGKYEQIEDLDSVIKCGELVIEMENELKKRRLENRVEEMMNQLMPVVLLGTGVLAILIIASALFIIRYRERLFDSDANLPEPVKRFLKRFLEIMPGDYSVGDRTPTLEAAGEKIKEVPDWPARQDLDVPSEGLEDDDAGSASAVDSLLDSIPEPTGSQDADIDEESSKLVDQLLGESEDGVSEAPVEAAAGKDDLAVGSLEAGGETGEPEPPTIIEDEGPLGEEDALVDEQGSILEKLGALGKQEEADGKSASDEGILDIPQTDDAGSEKTGTEPVEDMLSGLDDHKAFAEKIKNDLLKINKKIATDKRKR